MADSKFRQDIYSYVARIPVGKVMTYGQLALLAGHPGAARVVGQVAHFGRPDLPWHRVVNAKGGLAAGFVPDGRQGQARLLQAEGVHISNEALSLEEYLWWPTT